MPSVCFSGIRYTITKENQRNLIWEYSSRRTSLNGTGGYLKVGRKGNAKWFFSENRRLDISWF